MGRGHDVGRIAGVVDHQRNMDFDHHAVRGRVAADEIADTVDEMQAIDDGPIAIVSVSDCPDLGRVLTPDELELVAIGLEQAATAITEGSGCLRVQMVLDQREAGVELVLGHAQKNPHAALPVASSMAAIASR